MPFDAQPILQGERLELRPLRAEDWEALYAVASDWLIWEQHPARNRYEIDVFRAFFDEALAVRRRARRDRSRQRPGHRLVALSRLR